MVLQIGADHVGALVHVVTHAREVRQVAPVASKFLQNSNQKFRLRTRGGRERAEGDVPVLRSGAGVHADGLSREHIDGVEHLEGVEEVQLFTVLEVVFGLLVRGHVLALLAGGLVDGEVLLGLVAAQLTVLVHSVLQALGNTLVDGNAANDEHASPEEDEEEKEQNITALAVQVDGLCVDRGGMG